MIGELIWGSKFVGLRPHASSKWQRVHPSLQHFILGDPFFSWPVHNLKFGLKPCPFLQFNRPFFFYVFAITKGCSGPEFLTCLPAFFLSNTLSLQSWLKMMRRGSFLNLGNSPETSLRVRRGNSQQVRQKSAAKYRCENVEHTP